MKKTIQLKGRDCQTGWGDITTNYMQVTKKKHACTLIIKKNIDCLTMYNIEILSIRKLAWQN